MCLYIFSVEVYHTSKCQSANQKSQICFYLHTCDWKKGSISILLEIGKGLNSIERCDSARPCSPNHLKTNQSGGRARHVRCQVSYPNAMQITPKPYMRASHKVKSNLKQWFHFQSRRGRFSPLKKNSIQSVFLRSYSYY